MSSVVVLLPALRRLQRLFAVASRGLSAVLLTLGLAASTACEPTAPAGVGTPVRLSLFADQVGAAVSVRITVTGPGIATPIRDSATFVGTTATVTLTVPAGANRTALIEILDATRAVISSGSTTFDVVAGRETTAPPVVLAPATGTVVFTAVVGTVTVTVSGLTTPLAVGDTRSFTASVLDGNSQPLAGATVLWATSNPARATVNATTGVVTGVLAGPVTITATSLGAAGAISLSIQ